MTTEIFRELYFEDGQRVLMHFRIFKSEAVNFTLILCILDQKRQKNKKIHKSFFTLSVLVETAVLTNISPVLCLWVLSLRQWSLEADSEHNVSKGKGFACLHHCLMGSWMGMGSSEDRTSLVVEGLRLLAPNAEGLGSTPELDPTCCN